MHTKAQPDILLSTLDNINAHLSAGSWKVVETGSEAQNIAPIRQIPLLNKILALLMIDKIRKR